jgi:cytochrome c biogenesis protein CcmG/thiol:disulfide interchange protein DsbE
MPSSNLDRLLAGAIGALLVALLAVFAHAVREKVVGVGDAAPHFSIRTDNGLTVSPASFGGRLLVLNFWATWCPPCIEEMPSLDRMQQQLKDAGVVVLGISVDEDEAAYKRFLERARVSFLTARDPAAQISSLYGTYRYPETYVINQQGRVVQKIIGPTDWTDERMLAYLRSLLSL